MTKSTDTAAAPRRRPRSAREGTINRRSDGRWEARYFVQVGEKRERRSIYGPTERDVDKKLREALTAKDRGAPLPAGAGTVGAYLLTWIEGARRGLRPGTWTRYESLVRLYLVPRIGKVKLTALGPHHVDKLYADLEASGMTPATVHHVHRVLRRALGQAERQRLVVSNAASLATAPRPERTEMHTLTADQVKDLLAAVPTRDRAFYLLAVSTGMRLGELLSLRWSDVNLDRASLQVVRTGRVIAGQGFVEGPPKTARSKRQITLSPKLVDALSAHKVAQIDERWNAGQLWADPKGGPLVFPGITGRHRQGSNVTRAFHPMLAAAGLPRIRFHDLRHTAATLLLSANVHPKVVSEILGHANIAITLDTYSHVMPTMQREAAQAMEDLLG